MRGRKKIWVVLIVTAVAAAIAGLVLVNGGHSKPVLSKSGPTPQTPGDLLNLDTWRIALPVEGISHKYAEEIGMPELKTYQHPKFFHLNQAHDGVVFRAPVDGVTTEGSEYPRAEMREMTADGSAEASWSSKSGRHTMTVTQAITSVPKGKPEVVAGQLHDASDDIVMIRLEDKELFVEAGGDYIGTLTAHYRLGTKFTVRITADPNGVSITYNNHKPLRITDTGDDYYFKVGCYTQSNPGTETAAEHGSSSSFGEVVVYALSVSHT